MRRKIITGIVIALALVGTVAAQDYIYTNFANGYQDHLLPPSPCDKTLDATPVFYDKTVWVFYRCASGTTGANGVVYARRFFHPNDNAVPPAVPPPSQDPEGTISCPGSGHRACAILPAGVYPLEWANTVGR